VSLKLKHSNRFRPRLIPYFSIPLKLHHPNCSDYATISGNNKKNICGNHSNGIYIRIPGIAPIYSHAAWGNENFAKAKSKKRKVNLLTI